MSPCAFRAHGPASSEETFARTGSPGRALALARGQGVGGIPSGSASKSGAPRRERGDAHWGGTRTGAGAGGGGGVPPVRPPRAAFPPPSVRGGQRVTKSPARLPSAALLVAGASPVLGLDTRERGGRGRGDPRSPGSQFGRRAARSADAAGPRPGGPRTDLAGGAEAVATTAAAPAGAGHAKMFDSSQYPYNCFNYDADDYPAGSSDEEKRLTRPAYR